MHSSPRRVLCYVRPWSQDFFRYLCSHAFAASHVKYFSDFKGLDPSQFLASFYELERSGRHEWPDFIDAETRSDVISRCRLLRVLPDDEATELITAMTGALEALLDRERPDVVVSMAIDSYVLDLLSIVAGERSIPVLGMIPSPINGYVLITVRGELHRFRPVPDEECDAVVAMLAATDYRPTYTPGNVAATSTIAKRWIRECIKAVYYPIRARLARDPLNFHYVTSAMAGKRLSHPRFLHRDAKFDATWETRVKARKGPVIYLPLQVVPESNSDYWCIRRDFLPYEAGVVTVAERLAPEALVLVKEHPAMLGYRDPRFYDALRRAGDVALVPAHLRSTTVMERADLVASWSGSAGIEAPLRHKPVLDFGGPYYAMHRATRPVHRKTELRDVRTLLEETASIPPLDANEKREFVRHILSGCLPGSMYAGRGFSASVASHREGSDTLAHSLASYYDDWRVLADTGGGDWPSRR